MIRDQMEIKKKFNFENKKSSKLLNDNSQEKIKKFYHNPSVQVL